MAIKLFQLLHGSMEPTIEINDLIITKNCKQEDIKQGDIISYRRGEAIITHRIEKIVNESGNIHYITKGDNNYIFDEYKVKYKDIEGVYITKIPNVGKIASFFKNEKVVIVIIIILFILNYLNYKKSKEKIIRQEQRRKYEINKNFEKTQEH